MGLLIRALATLNAGGGLEETAARFLHECRLLLGADHCAVVRFEETAGQARILAYESDVVERAALPDVAPVECFRLAGLLDGASTVLVHDVRRIGASERYARGLWSWACTRRSSCRSW
jgi:hypothetical protein